MSLRDDERSQAIQIGAVLLFGVLILLMAMYQAFVVPDMNREVEANHLDTITQQMQDLRNGIISIPSIGDGRSVTLTLGTSYPPRFVALNPSPPTGTIRTRGTESGRVNVTIANAIGTKDEVADYWNGTGHTYPTGGILYRPGYHEYRNAPTIVYDNSMLVHGFEDGNLTRAAQELVDGRQLTLGTINGSIDTASSDSISVDLEAVSASSRRISVTNATNTDNVTISFASQYRADRWEDELLAASEFTNQSGHVVSVTDSPIPGTAFRHVSIEFELGVTYDLRLSRVGVGTGAVDTEAMYITAVGGQNVEQNETFTAEVRDRFNNPVSGVTVTPTSTPTGCTLESKRTNEKGQVHYECAERGAVDLQIDGGGQSYEQVTFGIPVLDDQAPVINEGATIATNQSEDFGQTGGGPPGSGNSILVSQITVEYSVSDQPSGLDHVALSLRDDGNLVMNTTHRMQGDTTREGTWVTPWFEEDDLSTYEVVVVAVDQAGNTDRYTPPL